ncbi:MAG: ATP-binding protein, partial [Thermomicrobiales bacterium]
SIQNARKHARANRVIVSVRGEESALIVTIEDNGRGFSPERVTTHMMGGAGLRGMQERAALVGGEIRIESAAGEGTRIELVLPLTGADTTDSAFDNPATDAALSGDQVSLSSAADQRSPVK